MKFTYVAYDRTGRREVDAVEARDHSDVTAILRRRGLFVSEVHRADRVAPAGSPQQRRIRSHRKRLKNLAMFSRQLHALVATGTPVVSALSALERQAKEGPWRNAMAEIRSEVEHGASLSAGMEKHPECFDAVSRSLVAAGESSGELPAMLDRLANVTRKQLQMRSAVVGALVYPCLLLAITACVLTVLLTFVIPRFGELFKGMGIPLPPTTAALVTVGQLFSSYWWAALGLLVGGVLSIRAWLKTSSGRRYFETVVLKLPQVGRIIQSLVTARIVRLLGVLLEGHVAILDAMDLTIQSVTNSHYLELLKRARDSVTRGESISSTFHGSDLISPSVYEALNNGEQSGQVGALLLNIADFLDDENEVVLKTLSSIIEPVILVCMGLLVGLVAVGMFMPLFDLTAMTTGAG